MSLRQTIELYDLLGMATVTGSAVASLLSARGLHPEVRLLEEESGRTEVLKAVIPGKRGRESGEGAPTLGIIGQLGGVGSRPAQVGLVSDADGAITALAAALTLADMAAVGDRLPGDVIVTTHICPTAPTRPHYPVPFMMSPVPLERLVRHLVDGRMEAILSIDTTRGNRIVNRRGVAISPTVKEGYILRVSEDLLDLLAIVTGRLPVVAPVTTQDITPYGNDLFHLNSTWQPGTVTTAPLVGVALTTESVVPGSATGASQPMDIEEAVRFCVEVAKAYGAERCRFFDAAEFDQLVALYGPMRHLQAPPPWDAGVWEALRSR